MNFLVCVQLLCLMLSPKEMCSAFLVESFLAFGAISAKLIKNKNIVSMFF